MVWVVANSNVALVKYWGKADEGAKHPAAPSLSVTLDSLSTAASVELSDDSKEDRIEGLPAPAGEKVQGFLNQFRSRFGIRARARVRLASNFPVAAGLASSASTFAALAKALVVEASLDLGDGDVADLARMGSGSACRSVYGGFVEWRPDGAGSAVEPVADKDHWRLRILVAVTSERPKAVGSSAGMRRTAETSPYYSSWIESGAVDLVEVRAGIRARSLSRVGPAAERNCMRMHAAAIAAVPSLLYWEPATIAVMRRVWELRERGIEAYFSIDAGPQVKVFCEGESAKTVEAALAATPGVLRVLSAEPGDAPRLVAHPPAWAADAQAPQRPSRAAAS
jgi:diphosphomevalonate decarboxylase